jgi:hypothetical protein
MDTARPKMRIGSVVFEGQYQQYIGTALVVGLPAAGSARAGPYVDVQALTQRRIVMRLSAGSIATLTAPAATSQAS